MPIKSYIVHPLDGKYKELQEEISKLPSCDIIPSKNKEILIVITDAKDDLEDKNIQIELNEIKSLKMLSLVSGFEIDQ